MDKQEYLQKIAEAAFNDELEKVGLDIKGMGKAIASGASKAWGGVKKGTATLGESYGNLGRAARITGSTVSSQFKKRKLNVGVMSKVIGQTLGQSKAAIATTAGGLGLAGGGTAYAMNRNKRSK